MGIREFCPNPHFVSFLTKEYFFHSAFGAGDGVDRLRDIPRGSFVQPLALYWLVFGLSERAGFWPGHSPGRCSVQTIGAIRAP
jgi:hypothetical protein